MSEGNTGLSYFDDDVLAHPKEVASADFVGLVGRAIQDALIEHRVHVGPLTQQEIARRLGVGRSQVNKLIGGSANMTLSSLAELLWAMECQPKFSISRCREGNENFSSVSHFHKADGVEIETTSGAPTIVPDIHQVQPMEKVSIMSTDGIIVNVR